MGWAKELRESGDTLGRVQITRDLELASPSMKWAFHMGFRPTMRLSLQPSLGVSFPFHTGRGLEGSSQRASLALTLPERRF